MGRRRKGILKQKARRVIESRGHKLRKPIMSWQITLRCVCEKPVTHRPQASVLEKALLRLMPV